MITDARVFDTDFVPSDVVHRDGEINHLSSTLRPLETGHTPDPAFVYGPSGTGKTCIAQYTVDKLREAVIDVTTHYVNCWENHSRFKCLYEVLSGIDSTIDIHRQSTPTDVLLNRVRDADAKPYVVTLDEVDQLDDKSLLYDLYRVSGVAMILIANDEETVFGGVDDRVVSRFSTMPRIHFGTYSTNELVSILTDRVEWGLRSDAISTSQLQYIARAASGDARVAIGTLRASARLAAEANAESITTDIVNEALSEAKAEIQQKNVDRFTPDQRLLYDILTEHGELPAGKLYDAYTRRASGPKTQATM